MLEKCIPKKQSRKRKSQLRNSALNDLSDDNDSDFKPKFIISSSDEVEWSERMLDFCAVMVDLLLIPTYYILPSTNILYHFIKSYNQGYQGTRFLSIYSSAPVCLGM